mmetsp:Transcript_11052/g.34894  ORF Transcript_11052/g.34894 Transcript_11052/m.34894 type:complete len:200 (+) Transcript_11052:642-1241(+)
MRARRRVRAHAKPGDHLWAAGRVRAAPLGSDASRPARGARRCVRRPRLVCPAPARRLARVQRWRDRRARALFARGGEVQQRRAARRGQRKLPARLARKLPRLSAKRVGLEFMPRARRAVARVARPRACAPDHRAAPALRRARGIRRAPGVGARRPRHRPAQRAVAPGGHARVRRDARHRGAHLGRSARRPRERRRAALR